MPPRRTRQARREVQQEAQRTRRSRASNQQAATNDTPACPHCASTWHGNEECPQRPQTPDGWEENVPELTPGFQEELQRVQNLFHTSLREHLQTRERGDPLPSHWSPETRERFEQIYLRTQGYTLIHEYLVSPEVTNFPTFPGDISDHSPEVQMCHIHMVGHLRGPEAPFRTYVCRCARCIRGELESSYPTLTCLAQTDWQPESPIVHLQRIVMMNILTEDVQTRRGNLHPDQRIRVYEDLLFNPNQPNQCRWLFWSYYCPFPTSTSSSGETEDAPHNFRPAEPRIPTPDPFPRRGNPLHEDNFLWQMNLHSVVHEAFDYYTRQP